MWRAERTLGHKPSARETGDAVDPGDLECLLEGWRREDARQSACEHRLPAARRANHEDVVAASSGDLECALGICLTANVGEVEAWRHGGVNGSLRIGRLG